MKKQNFTQNDGYVLSELIVDGEPIPATDSYVFENVTENHEISATFEEDGYIFVRESSLWNTGTWIICSGTNALSHANDTIGNTIIEIIDGVIETENTDLMWIYDSDESLVYENQYGYIGEGLVLEWGNLALDYYNKTTSLDCQANGISNGTTYLCYESYGWTYGNLGQNSRLQFYGKVKKSEWEGYKVSFYNRDGFTNLQPSYYSYFYGTMNLPANQFTKENCTFLGWSTSPNGEVIYTDGQSVLITEDMQLYAIWQQN